MGYGEATIVSGKLRYAWDGANAISLDLFTQEVCTADQEVSADGFAQDSGGRPKFWGLHARMNTPASYDDGYWAGPLSSGAGNKARIYRVDNGSWVQLAEEDPAEGLSSARFTLVGDALSVFIGGAEVADATAEDATYDLAGYAGVMLYCLSGAQAGDWLECDNLTTGAAS